MMLGRERRFPELQQASLARNHRRGTPDRPFLGPWHSPYSNGISSIAGLALSVSNLLQNRQSFRQFRDGDGVP